MAWRRPGIPKHLDPPLSEAAEQLGLTLQPAEGLLGHELELTGFFDELDVRVVAQAPRSPEEIGKVRITVWADGNVPEDLTLVHKGLERWLPETVVERRVILGDRELDAEVVIAGDVQTVLALLDQRTRREVVRVVVRGRVAVMDGELVFDGPLDLRQPAGLTEKVTRMVSLARRLELGDGSIPEMLAANATDDPDRHIRMLNLTLLQRDFPDSPEAWAASRAALADRRGAVRMRGAVFLAAEGNQVARDTLLSSNLEAEVRSEALGHFVAHLSTRELLALLLEALSGADDELRLGAIATMASEGLRDASESLRALFGHEKNNAVVAAAARALGELGATEAEPELVAGLTGEPPAGADDWVSGERDAEVLAATITALGQVGTIEAVEPLLAFNRSVIMDPLAKEAEAAARQIQRRLGAAGPGHLSVAEGSDERGALSLSKEGGALSLPKGQGAISVSDRASDD